MTFEQMLVCPNFFVLFLYMYLYVQRHYKIRCCMKGAEAAFTGVKILVGAICCNKNQLCQSWRKGSAAVCENRGYAQEKQDS